MQLIFLTAVAAALSQAVTNTVPEGDGIGNPESATKLWGNADYQCYQNCGRAMTEFNKCKGNIGNKHDCVCAPDSQFHHFYDQCVECPDYVLRKFNRPLSIPETECGISRQR